MIKLNETILINSSKELNLAGEINLTEKFIVELYNHSIEFIKSDNKLPCNPAPEKHPYKGALPLDNSFQKFIIGTFPPHTYQSDLFDGLNYCSGKKVSQPNLPFYHGNREMLWKYLLGEEQFNSLDSDRKSRKIQIIDFLKNKKINYADIIDFCQRREYNADDSNLFNIILNEDLMKLLTSKKSDNILLVFNTGSFFTSSGMNFSARVQKLNPKSFVFDMFVYLLIENGRKVEVQVLNGEKIVIHYANRNKLKNIINILSFNLFIDGEKFYTVAGPSPANGDGRLQDNVIFKRFIKKNCPNKSIGFQKKEFKRFVYQTALLGNCQELEFLNFD
jgi:hypothetical protein